MAIDCSITSRQVLLGVLHFYLFVGFVCQVFVDGRMRCSSYYCAGGNYGLVGDDYIGANGVKRSLADENIARLEARNNEIFERAPLADEYSAAIDQWQAARTAAVRSLPNVATASSEDQITGRRKDVDDLLLYLLEVRLAGGRRRLDRSGGFKVGDDKVEVSDAFDGDFESRRRRQQQQQQQLIDIVEADNDENQSSQDISRLRSRLLATWLDKLKSEAFKKAYQVE